MDLTEIRRLVAALVSVSGRHELHAKTGPILGTHPCARGKPECPFCRYGFPKERRSVWESLGLQPGDREGQWNAVFPRNDSLVNTFEPHLLLANMGNVDWRPCLNLWAVTENIMKYASKAPEGSMSGGGGPRCAQASRTRDTHSAWAAVRRGARTSLGSPTPQ